MSGTSFIRASVDGRSVLIPNDPDPGHQNPPLTRLNASYVEADRDNASAIKQIVDAGIGAMRGVAAKRVQKNLRGPG